MSHDRASGRRLTARIALGAAVVVAIGLRLAYVWSLRATPWFAFLNVDPGYYDTWARTIASGHWLGERPFYMDPLYPYLLGTLYAVAGHDVLLPRLVNIGLSAGSCLLIATLARGLAGRVGAALAGLAFALYAPDVFHAGEIDKTALSTFLVALGLVLLARRQAPLAAGSVLGLAILTRANLLAFVPVVAVWLVLDRAPTRPARRAVGDGVGVLLGVLFALLPVTVHNYLADGQFVLTTSQAGQNFYIGNCAENPQGGYAAMPFVRAAPPFEELDFRAEAERRTGHVLTPNTVSRFWFGEALRHWREHPRAALATTAQKFALFWNDFEIADSTDQYLAAHYSWVMRLPLLSFGWLLPWAVIGAATAWRDRVGRLLLAFTAIYAFTTVVFFVMARYRIQIVVSLLPLATRGMLTLAGWVRARQWPAVIGAVAALCATGWFAFHPVDVFATDNEVLVQQQLRHLGQVYAQAGEPAQALSTHLEAARICQRYCRLPLEDLFTFYTQAGRQPEGRAMFEGFLAARPGHPVALEYLARFAPDGIEK